MGAAVAVMALFYCCQECVDAGLTREWVPGNVPSTQRLEEEVKSLDSSDPFLKRFERTIHKMQPAQQQQLEAGILRQAEEEIEHDAKEAGGCSLDYSAPCPLSWVPRLDRETSSEYCEAPKDYKGYCETFKSFEFYTEDAKAEWAKSCDVKWPCKGDEVHSCPTGTRDFTLPCPEGFSVQSDEETCQAVPGRYTGMCPLVVNFNGFSDDAKSSWSTICGAYWPCKQDCVSDYEAICPDGWTHEGRFWCKAPASYISAGPCDGRWNFKYFTKDMKRAFEKSCQARFACENTCEKQYFAPCPKGWIEESNACKAPEDYTACGVNRVSFAPMTLFEKQRFESECNATWPCKAADPCEMEWDYPCPEGWTVVPAVGKTLTQMNLEGNWLGARCEPPSAAQSECRVEGAFQSNEEKRKWASMCELTWPCKPPSRKKKEQGAKTAETTTALGRVSVTGRRPRPPTRVTDRRELGKRGPVYHATGEIWPRKSQKIPFFTRIVGIEPMRAVPAKPLPPAVLSPQAEEEEGVQLKPTEVAYSAHRGYYGGLTAGFHLLGSSA